MRKKFLAIILSLACTLCLTFSLAACNNAASGGTNDSKNTDDSEQNNEQYDNGQTGANDDNEETTKHSLVKIESMASTCTENGNIEYWTCLDCGKYFSDSQGLTEISLENTIILASHTYNDNWTCTICNKTLTDSEGLTYTLSDDKESYIVYGIGSCTDTNIVIPYTYNGLPVTAIYGDDYIGAFYDCNSITSINIPNSVTYIGKNTFSYCNSLEYVNLGNNVTSIDKKAFYYCYSLTSLIIPDSVTSISENAFSHCSSLTSLIIPDSVTSISENAFSYCSSLEYIYIGSGVTSIRGYAFYHCSSLLSLNVNLKNKCYRSIDGNLYSYDGTKLIKYACAKSNTSFTIPSSVTYITGYAFQNCTSLENITIGDNVSFIGEFVFLECNSLTNITLPKSVKAIGYYAFYKCSLLESVTFADTNEWYITDIEGATSGTGINVIYPSENAKYLTNTYKAYYWYRSEN